MSETTTPATKDHGRAGRDLPAALIEDVAAVVLAFVVVYLA